MQKAVIKTFILISCVLLLQSLVALEETDCNAFNIMDLAPVLWLDGTDVLGDGSNSINGALISQWLDKSGNNNHAIAPQNSQSPIYSSNSSSLVFDGVDDILESTDLDYGPNDEISIIVLASFETENWPDGDTNEQGWMIGKDYYSNTPYGISIRLSLNRARGYRNNVLINSNTSPGEVGIFSMVCSENTFSFGDEIIKASASSVPKTNNKNLIIGAGNILGERAFKGNIYEIIIYDHALNACELELIEGYLAQKYQVLDELPIDHGFKTSEHGLCRSQYFEVEENVATSTVVGQLSCYDMSDIPGNKSFILIEQSFGDAFSVDTETGIISVNNNSLLDYEKYGAFSLKVAVEKNNIVSTEVPITINILNVAEGTEPPIVSQLWGEAGELWDPRGRLPDFAFAGYHSGEIPIPNLSTTINVIDEGVIANDDIDDQALIQQIIDENDNAVILFPAGVYRLESNLLINKSNIVLKGEGDHGTGTVFEAPYSATEYEGGFNQNFSYGSAGNIIRFHGAYNGTNFPIVEEMKRGDRTITVQDADQFIEGELVGILQTDDAITGTYFDHLHNDQTDGWPSDDPSCDTWVGPDNVLYFTIERIKGNLITLEEPIPFDIRIEWEPKIFKSSNIEEVGIENIRIKFPYVTPPSHLSEPGYNGIHFKYVKNGWIKNISIAHSDNGIYLDKGCNYNTVTDIDLQGRRGHHGSTLTAASYNLLEEFTLTVEDENSPWLHAMTVNHSAHGNVISKTAGNGVLYMDSHRDVPFENLFTETESEWNYYSSGRECAGPHTAARSTYWNNFGLSGLPHSSYGEYFGHIQTNVIGNLDMPAHFTDDREWFENRSNLSPSNLYESQLSRRLSYVPEKIFSSLIFEGNRDNYCERDPSRWEVSALGEEIVYNITTSDVCPLTNNKVGEYAILDQNNSTCIRSDFLSLEDLNSNNSADAALILNYTDDDNYYYAVISNDASLNGIYALIDGVNILKASAGNIDFNKNWNNISFQYLDNKFTLKYNGNTIAEYAISLVFTGNAGIGSIDDAVAFDNTELACTLPDLSPVYTLLPTLISGMSSLVFNISIVEKSFCNTEGPITVVMPKNSHLDIDYDPQLTDLFIFNLDNADWTYDNTNSSLHIWTSSSSIAAGSSSSFGFSATYDPDGFSGSNPFTVTILSGSGSETVFTNNIDVETLQFFSGN